MRVKPERRTALLTQDGRSNRSRAEAMVFRPQRAQDRRRWAAPFRESCATLLSSETVCVEVARPGRMQLAPGGDHAIAHLQHEVAVVEHSVVMGGDEHARARCGDVGERCGHPVGVRLVLMAGRFVGNEEHW